MKLNLLNLVLVSVVICCTTALADEISATLSSGEEVRVIVAPEKNVSSESPTLCIEITSLEEPYPEAYYSTFAEFAENHKIFEGYSGVEIRPDLGAENQTIVDVMQAAEAHGIRNVAILGAPCPE